MRPEDFNRRVEPKVQKPRPILDDQRIMNAIAGFSAPVIFLSLSLILSLLLTAIANKGFLGLTPSSIPISVSLLLTQCVILLTGVIILLMSGVYRTGRENFLNVIRFKNFSMSSILIGLGLGAALLAIYTGINVLLMSLGFESSSGGSKTTESVLGATGFFNIAFTLIFVCITNPVLEEFFARGSVMGLIENAGESKGYRIVAVIFSSALFSILHFQGFSSYADLRTLIIPFLSALYFALIAIKSKSIYPAMAAHIGYNSSIMLISHL